jgi:hypothetical protein
MKLDSHVVGPSRLGSRRSSLSLAISAALSLAASCGEDEKPALEEDAGTVWKTPETIALDPTDGGRIARASDAGRAADAAVEAAPREREMDASVQAAEPSRAAPQAMNDGGAVVSANAGDASTCRQQDAHRLKWRFLQGSCADEGAIETVVNLAPQGAQDAGHGCVDESIALASDCRGFIDTTCPLLDGAQNRIGVAHTTGALDFASEVAGVLKRDVVRNDGTTCSSAYEVTVERAF